jgi:hypothetical protein
MRFDWERGDVRRGHSSQRQSGTCTTPDWPDTGRGGRMRGLGAHAGEWSTPRTPPPHRNRLVCCADCGPVRGAGAGTSRRNKEEKCTEICPTLLKKSTHSIQTPRKVNSEMLALALTLAVASNLGPGAGPWEVASPESQGLSSAALDEAAVRVRSVTFFLLDS